MFVWNLCKLFHVLTAGYFILVNHTTPLVFGKGTFYLNYIHKQNLSIKPYRWCLFQIQQWILFSLNTQGSTTINLSSLAYCCLLQHNAVILYSTMNLVISAGIQFVPVQLLCKPTNQISFPLTIYYFWNYSFVLLFLYVLVIWCFNIFMLIKIQNLLLFEDKVKFI